MLNIREPLVILDLETTGLSPFSHEIIEVAAMRIDPSATRQAALQHLVRPTRPLPRHISELTGITQSDLDATGVEAHRALAALSAFIGDLPIVAFNAVFDIGFLNAGFAAHGLTVVRSGHSCALKLARSAWPGLPSYKLAHLSQLHGLNMENAHRALDDVRRCAHVYYRAAGVSTRDT